jgi:hypothetical protein
MRNYAWIALVVALSSGSLVHAQGPYGNLGYGNPQPMVPYGTPMSRPMMPYGSMAKPSASEPYLVPTEPTQAPAAPAMQPMLPPAESRPGTTMTENYDPGVSFEPMGPPPEPYTLYEGPRSLAEVKQDDVRIWAQANFIHWWVRRDSPPPLVTTGDPNNITAGALGNTDTVILLGGDRPIGPAEFSGVQTSIGMWLDEERLVAVELGGFWLGKNSRQYHFGSDANGNPTLVQPAILGGVEVGLLFAIPATPGSTFNLAGSIAVNTVMDFNGAELNLTRNIFRTNGCTLDFFGGVRYMYLNEALTANKDITVLPGADFQVPFNNVFQPAGSNLLINDSFNVTNRFYGGQIGARFDYAWRSLDIGAVMKLAAGATSHTFIIDGSTTLNAIDGTRTTVPGGTYAQPSNIGRYTSTDFSVIPELTLTSGYQITSNLRLTVGYNLLYWSRVMRVGNNIDRNVDQTPTLSPTGIVPAIQPAFPAIRTDFWAQGVNVGMELKF